MAEHDGNGRSRVTARGPKRKIFAGAAFLFLAFALLFARFAGNTLYDYPANPAPLAFPANTVIACLAGGKHRIEAAFDLFSDGVGDQLWIIGAGKHSTLTALAHAQSVDILRRIPWDRFDKIQIESESRNTIENAFAVKRLLDQNPSLKNLVLVTSPYHMRRSMLMIEHHIRPDVHVIPFTPISADFGREDWWHTWSGFSLTLAETVKFELARILVPHLSYF